MPVARLTVSFDENLARAVRRAAGGRSMSSWLADAAPRELRAEGLVHVVHDWEKEHGILEDAELRAAVALATQIATQVSRSVLDFCALIALGGAAGLARHDRP